jgi:thymidylate synthase
LVFAAAKVRINVLFCPNDIRNEDFELQGYDPPLAIRALV